MMRLMKWAVSEVGAAVGRGSKKATQMWGFPTEMPKLRKDQQHKQQQEAYSKERDEAFLCE